MAVGPSTDPACAVDYFFAHVDEVEPALADLAPRRPAVPAVWVGTIPDEALYRAVDTALRARGVHLLNDPEAHLDVFEFDRAYPRLADLTARTVTVTAVDQVAAALTVTGLPAFLKGALLSRKHSGWSACVATTLADAEALAAGLLRRRYLSRGRVLVRELLPLRRLHVPAFLEYFAIPYSGSDVVTHATCVARARMKAALALGTADANLHLHAALVHALAGRPAEARVAYERARELDDRADPRLDAELRTRLGAA